MSKSLPLQRLCVLAALGAVTAFVLRAPAAPLMTFQSFVRPDIAAYAVLFAAAFAVFCVLGRRVTVRFSLKPQGLEKIDGFVPRAARAVVVALVFLAPLLLAQNGHGRSGPSLESIIAASDKKATTAAEPGYKPEDRATLGKIMGETHETP